MERSGGSNVKDKGFDANRLRKLQLDRASSSLANSNNVSFPESLRRWNSLSDSRNVQSGISTTAATVARGWNSGNTTPLGTVYPASTRPNYPDEPVVFVLPDPNKKPEIDSFSKSSNPLMFRNQKFLRDEEEEEVPKCDLNYPHGMPRWGPIPVTPTTQLKTPPTISQSIHSQDMKQGDTARNTSNPILPGIESTRKYSSKANKKAKQKAVVEKAQAQSMRAAARAVQNIADASPGSLPKLMTQKMAEATYPKPGLGSRLFGRAPRKSLLQSARIKQAHVMQTDHHVQQAQSLDDPVQQQQQKVGTRSVQSFELLQSQSTTRATQNIVKEGTVESEDEASLSIDESVASHKDYEEQLDGPSESQSWSMGSCSSDDKLSIDETIKDSVGDEPSQEEDSGSEEDASKQPQTPRSSSIPAMILSEGEPESVSRHSDFSSLELRASTDSGKEEVQDDDEFYDATDSSKASASQSFDAKRCRELLRIRNEYLEREEQKKLLSPQAAIRLSSAPYLCREADETTLLELAARSRWIEQTLANTRITPAETTISSPFSAAYPIRNFKQEPALASMPDDGPAVEPISLAAPRALSQQVMVRKEPWHVAGTGASHDEDETLSQEPVLENDSSSCSAPRATKMPFKVKLKRFLRRCLYIMLCLFWATRAFLRLLDSFSAVTESAKQQVLTINLADDRSEDTSGEILFDFGFPFANSSRLLFQPRTTPFAWTDMPILLIDPSPAPDVAKDFENVAHLSQLKCPANFSKTIRKFWENFSLSKYTATSIEEEIFDTPTNDALHPTPTDLFIVGMLQGQTFCDTDIHMCFSTSEVAPKIHLTIPIQNLDLRLDIQTFVDELDSMDFQSNEDDDATPKKHLLKSIGDMLRKRGQQLLEEQRKMRRRCMPQLH